MDINQQVAIVTGASSGVGAQTAIKLADQGAKVIINYYKNKNGAINTLEKIRKMNGHAAIFQADIRNKNEAKALVEFSVSQYQKLNIVVNNAGSTTFVPHDDLDALTDEIWLETLQTNLMGPFYVSRAASHYLQLQGGGEIIMTSSIAGLTALGSSIAYCASKAALNSLTKTLAKALGSKKIRDNALCPGLINGEWAKKGWHKHWDDVQQFTLNASAIQHISTPEDVATSIISIITGADNMTGQLITLDSGLTL